MQTEFKWSTIPREVVHDKASYMVPAKSQRLNVTFAKALKAAGLRSWVGDVSDSAEWMVGKFGDVYPHETLISHIRRLLEQAFRSRRLNETIPQFMTRVPKVEKYSNAPSFKAPDGRGLPGLARDLRSRCAQVIKLKGKRIPKLICASCQEQQEPRFELPLSQSHLPHAGQPSLVKWIEHDRCVC